MRVVATRVLAATVVTGAATRALAAIAIVVSVAACFQPAAEGVCRDGETRACYAGPRGTEGIGACTPGMQTCSSGVWEIPCLGDVTPFVERCNGVDDDCNGVLDDVEEFGETCNGANGCPGVRRCVGDDVACVPQEQNACGLCGGPDIAGLGVSCTVNDCDGELVCTDDGTGTECGAPAQNECGLCGGPSITGLGNVCAASAGCAGRLACNGSGTNTTCDCSVNICNDNGTIRPVRSPEAGDLVITEWMPSPSSVSDTAGEWFEVKALVDLDLNNLLLDRVGDSNPPNAVRAYDCIHLTAGSYAVFARNADSTLNGGVTGVVATFSFSMLTGSVATPGDIAIFAAATEVDSVSWTSSRAAKSLQVDPDATDPVSNDQAANLCDGTTPYNSVDFGSPGVANAQCPAALLPGECDDNGTPRAIVKPGATDLVITEVMANPKIEPAQEWFEIVNAGSAPFDLNGLGLDRAGDSALPTIVGATACKSLAPTSLALFARSGDSVQNGTLPAPDALFTFSMVNSGGDVRVVDPSTCSGTPLVCTTIYDSVTYSSSTDGVSSQVKPGFFTTAANDSAANYCFAVTPYGDATNLGTPRATNVCN